MQIDVVQIPSSDLKGITTKCNIIMDDSDPANTTSPTILENLRNLNMDWLFK